MDKLKEMFVDRKILHSVQELRNCTVGEDDERFIMCGFKEMRHNSIQGESAVVSNCMFKRIS